MRVQICGECVCEMMKRMLVETLNSKLICGYLLDSKWHLFWSNVPATHSWQGGAFLNILLKHRKRVSSICVCLHWMCQHHRHSHAIIFEFPFATFGVCANFFSFGFLLSVFFFLLTFLFKFFNRIYSRNKRLNSCFQFQMFGGVFFSLWFFSKCFWHCEQDNELKKWSFTIDSVANWPARTTPLKFW